MVQGKKFALGMNSTFQKQRLDFKLPIKLGPI